MSRSNILLDHEANGDRSRQRVGVGEKGDASETPVLHGERRPDVTEPSTLGGGQTQSIAPPTGVRAPRAADLVPPSPLPVYKLSGRYHELAPLSSDEATGGLDQHPHALHEWDGITAVEDGKVARSVRKLGSFDAFAPPDTFVVEARYLLARSGCFSKMEVPIWWRSGMLLSLLGFCMLCEGDPWAPFFLRAGADILFANWDARSEVRHVGTHEPSVGVTPALATYSQRVGAPTPPADASRAERTPSLATDAPRVDYGAPVAMVEAPCSDEGQRYAVVGPHPQPPLRACDVAHVVVCTASPVSARCGRLSGPRSPRQRREQAPSGRRSPRQRSEYAPSDWYDQDTVPIARRTYLELCREGKIEKQKYGKKVLVKREVFDAWIAGQGKSPPLAAAPPPPTPAAPTNEELLRGAGVLVPLSPRRAARSSSDPPKGPKPRARRRPK